MFQKNTKEENNMNRKIALSVCLISLLIIAGLATPGFAEKVLRIGTLGSDAISLDPHMSTKSQDKIIFPMIFNGLVRFKPGTADLNAIEPDLAESWQVSDNQLVWTFKLRRGVMFHGGYGELTADDVVFSLAKAGEKSTAPSSITMAASLSPKKLLKPWATRPP
jgi:peptide/nickel transport system substrate-binding protein